MQKVLTIAGSDSSGGAGIQADIKTITAHKIYAMSVITAITAQNTQGVYGVLNIDADMVKKQLDAVFSDITPDAVKIGMVSCVEIVDAIVEKLTEYKGKNIVLDPVMVSTSGSKLIANDAIERIKSKLFPIADIITPNLSEAEVLTGEKIAEKEDMAKVGLKLSQDYDRVFLIKGGHLDSSCDDLIATPKKTVWLKGDRLDNPNTHGTGCTLSSCIACNLACGFDMETSVKKAKEYVYGAIRSNLDIGKGKGPLNHMWNA